MSLAISEPRRSAAPRRDTANGRALRPLERPQARTRPRMTYALVALGGAALIALAQILLTIAITQDSFRLADLTAQQQELTLQTAVAEDALAGVSSPQQLAANAADLGLVVGGAPTYIRMSDGALIGDGQPAVTQSTIDPRGGGAVPNALLDAPETTTAPPAGEQAPVAVEESVPAAPEEPAQPPVAEGLPSPTTR